MPRPTWRSTLVSLAVAAATVVSVPAGAQATGVAYIDGNEVWVSSLDGSQKLRLSNGENDWREVGQNDAGYVVATRREEGKISELATFTIWNPDGTIKDFGPLAGLSNGGLSAYPLGLELTPDAGAVIYGYSNLVYHFPGSTLRRGFFVLPSATRAAPVGGPLSVSAARYPSLVGERVIGSPDDHTIAVQAPTSIADDDFTTWPGIEAQNPNAIDDVEVASTGRTVALGIYQDNTPRRVFVVPTPGLGLAPVALNGGGDVGACWLVPGEATDPTFSPDGTTVAWTDPRGVVIAGTPTVVPTTPPEDLCTFSRPATVISPTGKRPAIGGIDVGAILAARNPAPGPGPGPGGNGAPGPGGPPAPPTPPPAGTFKTTSSLKLSSLGGKSGATVELTPSVSGKATFVLTVDPKVLGKKGTKPITIATGKGTLTKGKLAKVKLKLGAAGKKAKKKLKKKRATLTVTVGGASTTITVKLS